MGFLSLFGIFFLIIQLIYLIGNVLYDSSAYILITSQFCIIIITLGTLWSVREKKYNGVRHGLSSFYFFIFFGIIVNQYFAPIIPEYSNLLFTTTALILGIWIDNFFAIKQIRPKIQVSIANLVIFLHFYVINIRHESTIETQILYLMLSMVFLNLGMFISRFIMKWLHSIEKQIVELEAEKTEVLRKIVDGVVPICPKCKKVTIQQTSYSNIETYIKHVAVNVDFSHSYCPECVKELFPGMDLSKFIKTS